MRNTLEIRLVNTLKTRQNSETVKDLWEEGVNCNLSNSDGHSGALTAENNRRNMLPFLYEHHQNPT